MGNGVSDMSSNGVGRGFGSAAGGSLKAAAKCLVEGTVTAGEPGHAAHQADHLGGVDGTGASGGGGALDVDTEERADAKGNQLGNSRGVGHRGGCTGGLLVGNKDEMA